MSTSSPPTSGLTPQALTLIRFAMLTVVLGFGGIAIFLTSSGQFEGAVPPETATQIRYAFYGVLLGVGGLLGFVYRRWKQTDVPARRGVLSLIGYALGESLALFGAIYILLTGSTMLFGAGLIAFLGTFLLFPVERDV